MRAIRRGSALYAKDYTEVSLTPRLRLHADMPMPHDFQFCPRDATLPAPRHAAVFRERETGLLPRCQALILRHAMLTTLPSY